MTVVDVLLHITCYCMLKDSWKMGLRNKFKNVRRHADGPLVAENRQKYGHAAAKRKRGDETSRPARRKLVGDFAASVHAQCLTNDHCCNS